MTRGRIQHSTWSLGLFLLVTLISSRLTLADELSDFSDFVANFIETQTMPAGQTVGLGISVVNNSGSTPFYAKGFGYRDKENNLPVDEYTLFPIGSVTKSFAAVLAVKILSQKFPQYGEQVLEIPVQDLLPSNSRLNWTLSDRYRTEKMSFRDLLSHRSCTTNDLSGPQYGAVNDPLEVVYRARYEQESCPFRTVFVYNSAMYVLAGHLLGEIAGKPFETLMSELLLELGMTRSGLSNITEDYKKMPNFTQAYYLNDNNEIVKGEANLYGQLSLTKAASGIYSTLTDMAKYMTFHMNGGHVDGKEILTKEQHSWITKIGIPLGPGQSYGLGLILVYVPGEERPLLNHNGYYPPYQAEMTIFPSLGISVFSATSGPGCINPTTAAKSLHNAIFDYFLAKKEKNTELPDGNLAKEALQKLSWVPQESLLPSFSKDSKKIEKSFAKESRQGRLEPTEAIGKFGAPVQGEIEVSYKNESLKTLQLTYGTWGQADLTQIDDQGWLYKINWTSPMVMFHRSYYDTVELENLLEFKGPDLAVFRWYADFWINFERNLTLANLPEIPWEENSCGAK